MADRAGKSGGLLLYGTSALGSAPSLQLGSHAAGRVHAYLAVPSFSPFEVKGLLTELFGQPPSIDLLLTLWAYYGGVVGEYEKGWKNNVFNANGIDRPALNRWLKLHHRRDKTFLSTDEYAVAKGVAFKASKGQKNGGKWTHAGRQWDDEQDETGAMQNLMRRDLVQKVPSVKAGDSLQYAILNDTIMRAGMLQEENEKDPHADHVLSFGFEDFIEAALRALVESANPSLACLGFVGEVTPSVVIVCR